MLLILVNICCEHEPIMLNNHEFCKSSTPTVSLYSFIRQLNVVWDPVQQNSQSVCINFYFGVSHYLFWSGCSSCNCHCFVKRTTFPHRHYQQGLRQLHCNHLTVPTNASGPFFAISYAKWLLRKRRQLVAGFSFIAKLLSDVTSIQRMRLYAYAAATKIVQINCRSANALIVASQRAPSVVE